MKCKLLAALYRTYSYLSAPAFPTLHELISEVDCYSSWLFFSRYNQSGAADSYRRERQWVSLDIYLLDSLPVGLQLQVNYCPDPTQLLTASRSDAVYQCVPVMAPLSVSQELVVLTVPLSLTPNPCVIICTFYTLTISLQLSLY